LIAGGKKTMRLDLKLNSPVTMVGDGKKPNLFWVTASTDFSFAKKDEDGIWNIDYAEGLMKKHGIESKSFKDEEAVFDNAREALDYAKDLSLRIPSEPEKDCIHRVTIEDRLCGTAWECELIAYPFKEEWSSGWKFEQDERGGPDLINILKNILKSERDVPKEHSMVRLIAVVNDQEGTFPVGTIGTIVSVYGEGQAFEVEIETKGLKHPVVITVLAKQLEVNRSRL
jgi:hypothetical protein